MMKSTVGQSRFARESPNTGSLGKKSVMEELRTCRGTSNFEDAVISAMFGVSIALGTISRSQEVLLDKIEYIARRVDVLEKEVISRLEEIKVKHEMNSLENLELPTEQEMQDWLNSPMQIQEAGSIPDLACSETLNYWSNPCIDLTFKLDGSGETLVQANLASPMKRCQKPT